MVSLEIIFFLYKDFWRHWCDETETETWDPYLHEVWNLETTVCTCSRPVLYLAIHTCMYVCNLLCWKSCIVQYCATLQLYMLYYLTKKLWRMSFREIRIMHQLVFILLSKPTSKYCTLCTVSSTDAKWIQNLCFAKIFEM